MAHPDDDRMQSPNVERWFLARGIPHFIEDYSATRDVFTRTLPVLTLVVLFELVGALNFAWAWWVNVGVAAAGLGALLGVWAGTNALRHQPAAGPSATGSVRPSSACSSWLPPPSRWRPAASG